MEGELAEQARKKVVQNTSSREPPLGSAVWDVDGLRPRPSRHFDHRLRVLVEFK